MHLLHMAPGNILLKQMLTDDSINKKSENLRFIDGIMVVSTEKHLITFVTGQKAISYGLN